MTAKWKQRLRREAQAFGQLLRPARLAPLAAGAAILTFGLHNIHTQTGITEGGVLGLLLFVNHWTGLPASVVSPVLDLLCYLLALRFLGGQFIRTSLISTAAVALCFKFWESFPCLLPDLSGAPIVGQVGKVFSRPARRKGPGDEPTRPGRRRCRRTRAAGAARSASAS